MSIDFIKNKIVKKIWGSEKIYKLKFIKKNDFKILKTISIKKGNESSLQFHLKKKEMISIIHGSGTLKFFNESDNKEIVRKFNQKGFSIDNYKLKSKKIREGDTFYVDNKTIHQITSKTNIVFSEISTDHLKDVIRLKDKYGRK